MDLGLQHKVAIVTGASRGLGRGIALALAREGCHLSICARQAAALEQAAAEMRAHQVRVLPLALDLSRADQITPLVEQTLEQFGRLDILINNVGGNRRGEFESTTEQDWQDIIELNLMAQVRLSRAVVPHMRRQGGGVIIFIASIFGRESGGRGLSIYNTTKSAVISLAKIMAVELAPHKIRVNSVAPGSIRFPGGSWDKRCQQDPQGMAEFVKRELPLGRFGTVEEVANVVAFLASERASLITGACLNVDGCQSRSLI
ncbi:MAG: SDR family oxidoreductase [candidate division KSB1 bacterium]|nr:SDR family oxidoreductase [candidate division KSB1 bacterium]MDZ7275607.1 SDR family oxidoreductase [candidate division KSB1 bacterium]MDZ7284702.1 SDR family oxidoreductase [candidate division KSB1 bacterium]MDZ7297879.1 SDR family oxidoreductase [candidate division KSB1 bacterium]MDZ7305993.1 SDR family oxidoreductase [candidate division KSB1 bacterium]